MIQKIKSIEKRWGEDSIFYHTEDKFIGHPTFVHEITEEWKEIGPGRLLVYRGYQEPGHELKFEIEAGSGISLTFWEVGK